MNDLTELIHVNTVTERITVSARELHDKLQIQTDFRHWFPRMTDYGFVEGEDFNPVKNVRVQDEGGRQVSREIDDAEITLEMAKQICMIQRTDIGRQYREYFIQLEKDWNSPEKVMARALGIAKKQLESMSADVKRLEEEKSALTVQNETYRPKAEYFDQLVDRKLLTNFTDTAKELGVQRKKFLDFLFAHKYIYRNKHGVIKPYAQYADTDAGEGLFHIKECMNEKTDWNGIQTLVTVKGKETFRLLMTESES
ncbi:MAG: antA/AntB antirepressor family protein [Eubacteriales bacterium]|nr:antA/AntB antirepressor family protein [Eubacteriales bacterium]